MSEKKYLFLAFLGSVAGAWLVTLPAGLHPGRLLLTSEVLPPGLPLGDQAFFLFSLWWTPEALFHLGTHPWFTPLMGAPEGVSLLYSSIVLLLGLAWYPFRGFLNGIAIYNFSVMASIALTAFFTLLAARKLGAGRGGALLAGAILFYPPLYQNQPGHLNVISGYWIPLGYYCYLLFERKPGPRRAMLCAGVWGLCFHVCPYQTIHLSLLLALDAAWRLWKARGGFLLRQETAALWAFASILTLETILLSFLPAVMPFIMALTILAGWVGLLAGAWSHPKAAKARRAALPALLLALVAAAPFFLVRGLDPRLEGSSPAMEVPEKVYWSAQPLLYVLSPAWAEHFLNKGFFGASDLLRLDPNGEFSVFPGYALWAIVLLVLGNAFFARKSRKPRNLRPGSGRWLVFAAVFAVLSFGPVLRWGIEVQADWAPSGCINLPGLVFHHLPLLDGYRAFTRMGFLVLFCLAIYVGMNWEATVLQLFANRRRLQFSTTLLAAALVLAGRISLPAQVQEIRVPPVYAQIAQLPQGTILHEFPSQQGQYLYPLTLHGIRLANHYVSRLDPIQQQKRERNAFISLLTDYADPDRTMGTGARTSWDALEVHRGFGASGIGAILLHKAVLPESHAAHFRDLFTGLLGLQKIQDDALTELYLRPNLAAE